MTEFESLESDIYSLRDELDKQQKDAASKNSSNEYRIRQLEEQLRNQSTPVVNNTTTYTDTTFMEKGLYAQLLFMVGRTNDAKQVAEKWIAEYEISNELRKPTKEEQAEMDKKKEEDFKKLREIFANMRKTNK